MSYSRQFHRLTVEEAVEALKSDVSAGLSSNDIEPLRKIHGVNKLEAEEKVTWSIRICLLSIYVIKLILYF